MALKGTVGGIDEEACGKIGPFLVAHGGERRLVQDAKDAIRRNGGVCLVDFERNTKIALRASDEPEKKVIDDVQFDGIVEMPTDKSFRRLSTVRERRDHVLRTPSSCRAITKDQCTVSAIEELQKASTDQAQDAQTHTKVKSAQWVPGGTVEEITRGMPVELPTDKRGFTLFMCANKTMGIDENANCFEGGGFNPSVAFPSIAAAASAQASAQASAPPAAAVASAVERIRMAAGVARAAAESLVLAADVATVSGGVTFPTMREIAFLRRRYFDE